MKYWTTIITGILMVLTCTIPAQAQETQTLFSSDVRHGGYGAPVFGFTMVNGQPAYLRGTRGAWVITMESGHGVNLGLGSYRTVTHVAPSGWPHTGIDRPDISTRYSGFEIEYVNRSMDLIHYSIQALVGSGTVRYEYDDVDELDLHKTSDDYFALQPGVNANLNVTSWFRLSGGVYYRYAGSVTLDGTGSAGLSGVTSYVALRFGAF